MFSLFDSPDIHHLELQFRFTIVSPAARGGEPPEGFKTLLRTYLEPTSGPLNASGPRCWCRTQTKGNQSRAFRVFVSCGNASTDGFCVCSSLRFVVLRHTTCACVRRFFFSTPKFSSVCNCSRLFWLSKTLKTVPLLAISSWISLSPPAPQRPFPPTSYDGNRGAHSRASDQRSGAPFGAQVPPEPHSPPDG